MGDPKRIRKKYTTPNHPWIKSRIDDEKRIRKEFCTKNKKEIWKMETVLKNFKTQAKNLISLSTPQSEIETQHLFRRVSELGLVQGDVTYDAILGLSIDNLMNRRLASIVYKKELARSVKQARQFIVHEHIVVGNKKISSPSYLVTLKEESQIGFAVNSPMFSEQHPERALPEAKEKSKEESKEESKEIPKKDRKKTPKKHDKKVAPKSEEPKSEEPKSEEPKSEEPKSEEPKSEEPKSEEPKSEEPKSEEPKSEEPKSEESQESKKTEEPKGDEQ